MATLNPQTETLALAARLRDDAQDLVEARASLFFAASVMHQEAVKATQLAEEMKAALVLDARAAASGKSVQALKADVALALGKHPSTVSAVDVVEAVVFAQAPDDVDVKPVDVQPSPVQISPSKSP